MNELVEDAYYNDEEYNDWYLLEILEKCVKNIKHWDREIKIEIRDGGSSKSQGGQESKDQNW